MSPPEMVIELIKEAIQRKRKEMGKEKTEIIDVFTEGYEAYDEKCPTTLMPNKEGR